MSRETKMTSCDEGFVSQGDAMSPSEYHQRLFGIEFAPLNIPLKRRLETLAVLQWILSFFFMGLTCVAILILLLFTHFYWLTLVYLVWYVYDYSKPERGGRTFDWMRRRSVWKRYRDYFPVKLFKTCDLDMGKNYIFVAHPHGVMGNGLFGNFATDATCFSDLFPGIRPRLLTLKHQFVFPVVRDYLMSMGLCTCSRASMDWLLSKEGTGNALVLVVGGATEALDAWPGSFHLRLKSRKGFVRLALKHGASLVPVFSFGENDVFKQKRFPEGSFLQRLQLKGKQILGFSAPIFHGRGIFNYTFGFLPYRCPINTVVGSPMDVKQMAEPTDEEVNDLHAAYVRHLEELFETNKLKYGVSKEQHLSIL